MMICPISGIKPASCNLDRNAEIWTTSRGLSVSLRRGSNGAHSSLVFVGPLGDHLGCDGPGLPSSVGEAGSVENFVTGREFIRLPSDSERCEATEK
jgi:hypothetical protein